MSTTDYSEKDPSYFGRARKDIAPLLPSPTGRVLEFGCATGKTLEWLKRDHGASETVGVEIEPRIAELARARVDQVLNLDAEQQSLPDALGRFNLILCLDVLEHLRDPWQFLARTVERSLAPGGTVIASVPNVRHAKVIFPLVFGGHWTYTDEGLLDRTHLRFFTRESAISLMSVGDLQVSGVVTAPPPGTRTSLLNTLTLGVFSNFLNPQILVAARRAPAGR